MDSAPHVTASQMKKPTKWQKCKEGEDMISSLPDFIIGRILSFLPTKEAVCTSVLSKRWIYLWTYITQLSFEDRDPYSFKKINKTCFINFVYRVLLHLNSSSIQSFSLVIEGEYDSSHIDQWISAVLNRRVKKLCVDSFEVLDLASYTLLKCQSLEELVLEMDCSVIRFPTFVRLSSLTVLKLSGIGLTSYSSNGLEELTLNFPVLRKYETKNCTWSGVKSVTLEVPLLEVVSIGYDPLWILDKSHDEIKFCAPRLAEFHYFGYILSETTILLAAHIASANFTIFSNEKIMQETGIPVCKLLNNNVECLKLELFEDESQQVKDALADIPAFGMLSRLELDLVTGEILLGLLLKSPCLKTLVLEELRDFDEELLNSATVPDCCLYTLKVVRFERIVRYEHELRFAKFVKENAKVLERISFSGGIKLRSSNLEGVKEMLKKSFTIVDFSSD